MKNGQNTITTYEFDEFRLDATDGKLWRGTEQISLTHKAIDLLTLFVERRGETLSKSEIIERLWRDTYVDENNLAVTVGMLRRAFGERANENRFIETVPRRGYRFVADVRQPEKAFVVEKETLTKITVEETERDEVGFSRLENRSLERLVRRQSAALTAFAALVVGFGLIFGYLFWKAGGEKNRAQAAVTGADAPRSIAVLPFVNLSGNAEREIFADGMTESLIGSLSKIENLKVISRNSVFALKGKEMDSREVGEKLGAATVLEGSVRENGGKIRVEVRLVDAANGEIIWSGDNYERAHGDVFQIQDDIARSVATRLRLKLTETDEQRLTKRETNSVEAFQAYAKGRYFWKKKDPENLEKSKKFFEEAIRLDPNYWLAYDGLVDYYFNSIWYAGVPQSEAVARAKPLVAKIVELAPDSPEAHDGLARVAGDKETQRRELERAVELAPNDSTIWHNYAFSLRHRPADALAAVRRAQELDPLSPSISTDVGAILHWNRRHDEAIAQYQKTIEAFPEFPSVYWNLRYAYEAKGMYAEAVAAFLESARLHGVSAENIAAYHAAFERDGYKGFREQHLKFLLEDSGKEQNTYWIAAEYAFFNEKEKTLEWMEKAVAARHFMIGEMQSDVYAFLRDDARFKDLLRRAGLEK